MALVRAEDVKKELYETVTQINVILKTVTDRLDKLEEPKKRTVK